MSTNLALTTKRLPTQRDEGRHIAIHCRGFSLFRLYNNACRANNEKSTDILIFLFHFILLRDDDESSMGNEAAYWSAPRQHLIQTSDVQHETEVYGTRNAHSPHTDQTPPPTPPEEDKDKFKCLYLLVEAAVAVRQQEKEREGAVPV